MLSLLAFVIMSEGGSNLYTHAGVDWNVRMMCLYMNFIFTAVFSRSFSSVAEREMECMCLENKLTTHENRSSRRSVPPSRILLWLL